MCIASRMPLADDAQIEGDCDPEGEFFQRNNDHLADDAQIEGDCDLE